jgi:xanthine dehydrogenase iron-sulfur cluster and FAD-binding subunit A
VAPTVVRNREIEEELVGKEVREIVEMIPGTRRTYESLIKPIEDQRCTIRYRKEISLRLLEYFLGTMLGSKV